MTPTFYIWHWTPKWKLRQLAVPVPGQEAGSKFSGTEGMFCTVLGCWLPLCLLCPFVKIFLRLPQTLIESSGKCNWITLYLNVIRISIRGKTTKVFKWLFFFCLGLAVWNVSLSACFCMWHTFERGRLHFAGFCQASGWVWSYRDLIKKTLPVFDSFPFLFFFPFFSCLCRHVGVSGLMTTVCAELNTQTFVCGKSRRSTTSFKWC